MKKNNLLGDLPKIGIRPVVDGRRNSLYENTCLQTMNMAGSVKKLYEENLIHTNGQKIECVIFPECIDGVARSAECAEMFARLGVGVVLTVASSWCFVTEVMYFDPLIPQAIWGMNSTERPGGVFLSAAVSAHNQFGIPVFQIYGHDVQAENDDSIPDDVVKKLISFAISGIAVATMRGKSYLGIGTVSMGIAGSMGNEEFFLKYLGMTYEHVDMTEVLRRIKGNIFDNEEYQKAKNWIKLHCKEGKDFNSKDMIMSREEKDVIWEYCAKMTIIIRDMMIGNPKLKEMGYAEESGGHNAIAAGFQGQRNWTDFLPNADFSESILNSSFDWNGIRQPFIVATENDSLNGATMLLLHFVSGCAQTFADIRTFWSKAAVKKITNYELTGKSENGFIHLINSGSACLDACGAQTIDGRPAMKHFSKITEEEADMCLEATTWGAANRNSFRGGGFSSTFLTKGGMPVTLARISIVDGLGPVLQLAEGETVELPEHVFDMINLRTDPTWPSTFFVPDLTGQAPFTSVYSVMANWGANHGVFCYGHVGADLITLASMLRIPVTMHNVDDSRLYRPTAWAMFGTKHPEFADVLACKNYGPIYG